MSQLTSADGRALTESAPVVTLVGIRTVTKPRKPSKAEARTVKESDKILADPSTTWHNWDQVRTQLGI
jgi:hypothetical protein